MLELLDGMCQGTVTNELDICLWTLLSGLFQGARLSQRQRASVRGQKARWFGNMVCSERAAAQVPFKNARWPWRFKSHRCSTPSWWVTRHLVHLLALHTNLCGPHLKTAIWIYRRREIEVQQRSGVFIERYFQCKHLDECYIRSSGWNGAYDVVTIFPSPGLIRQ